jgi:predicted nucleic acid-binding protein
MNAADTNVLVYAKDPRDPRKQAIAVSLISTLIPGVLLWQVACEFLAASRKLEGLGYSLREAWQDIEELRDVWNVVFPTWNTQTHAYMLAERYSISYWDALLLSACRESGVKRLYSEDLHTHNGLDGIEIVNPFEIR